MIRPYLLTLACALATFGTCPAVAQGNNCGQLANAYGPFDYRTDKDKLGIVEQAHFQPVVEMLIKGHRGTLGGDLDYTLRAFPNHHRALISVMQYGLKKKTPQPSDLARPVECYFDRALRFQPNDHLVRMIYAEYLMNHQRQEEAEHQLAYASAIPGLHGLSHQNIGTFYVSMKKYEAARKQAWRAIELGVTPNRLIGLLEEAGQWMEPPAGGASAPSPNASHGAATSAASSAQ